MNTVLYSEVLQLTPEDNQRLFNLCGKLNEHLKLIESRLGVMIKQRGYTFAVSGEPVAVKQACDTLNNLYHATDTRAILDPKLIHLHLQTITSAAKSLQDRHMEIRLKKAQSLRADKIKSTICKVF